MTAPQRITVGRPSRRQLVGRAPAPASRRTPQLRPVPPLAPSPRVGLLVLAMAIMVFGILIGATMLHSNLITGQRKLDQLDADTAEAKVQQERLRLQVARLDAPERIVSAAVHQGMVAPSEVRWLAPVPPESTAPTPPASGAPVPETQDPSSELAAEDRTEPPGR